MMSGAFITLEGTEGVGKSTLLERIRDLVTRRGHELVVTREPGGTPLGEQLRTWLLDSDHAHVSSEVEALLMFAARGYHLDNVIEPAISAGTWVLCDRFTDATFAYQGGGRGLDIDLLETLRDAVQKSIEPDLTLLLDAPAEIGLGRIANRQRDHFEREAIEFFQRVRDTYLRLAADNPQRIRIIDASLTPDEVWAGARDIVISFMDEYERKVPRR